MRCFSLLLAWLVFFTAFPCLGQEIPVYPDGEDWELIKERNGVKAYTRKVEGRVLKEFRITCTIDAPYDKVYGFMHQSRNFESWCAPVFPHFSLLDSARDGGFYTYLVIPTPFFTRNRDVVFRNDIRDITDGFIMRLIADPQHIPEKEPYIRVQTALAVMTFIKKGNTQVECQYRGAVDPAGELPTRFANLTAYNFPLKNIMELKQVLEML